MNDIEDSTVHSVAVFCGSRPGSLPAYRAAAVENALQGKTAKEIAAAAEHAADSVETLSDTFASAEYRKHVACVYTKRTLLAAMK